MERLTKLTEDGQAVMRCDECDLYRDGCCTVLACRNRLKDRLADYEDTGLRPDEMNAVKLLAASADHEKARRLIELSKADANGLVVALPCKVGDTVYRPLYGKIWEGMVLNFCFDGAVSASIQNVTGGAIVFEHNEDFGKTVFLTREEAEAALKGAMETYE